jgi:hypothetical protein
MTQVAHDQDLANFKRALSGESLPLDLIATAYLPQLLEAVEDVIEDLDAKAKPAREFRTELRNELERRLDAEGATQLKLGDHVVRFEKIPAKAIVRTEAITPDVIDKIAEVVPSAILSKALWTEFVPAKTIAKSHLTYLKKFLECGPEAVAWFNRLVDPGTPGRKLVVEREQKNVAPVSVGGA